MRLNVLNRRIHYWASAVIAVPLLVVAITGSVLQLRKQIAWVQPPEQRGSVTAPTIELSHILASLIAHETLNVTGWHDINRLDVRPEKGIVKAWLKSNWEAQIDLGTGEILQVAFRRSDWIESIHDGSIFGDGVKLGIFFPSAIGLILLWCGGIWMFIYPLMNKRRARRRAV